VQYFAAANGSIAARMEQSLLACNEALTNAIEDNGALKGMGCTLVAGYLDEDGLRWISVGDSALLLYRNGTLRRLNADHSLGAMLNKQVEAGLMAPEAALNDPRRRALRSALTGGPIPLKDSEFDAYPLQPSDWVVLATDGLEVLTGNEIATAIQKHEDQEAEIVARSLIAAVEQKRERYQDNTTVIVLRAAPAPRQEVRVKRADESQENADMAKTVLINPQGRTGDAAKEPSKKSWWPRVKLLLLAAGVLEGIMALGLIDRTMAADRDRSCCTGGIEFQANMNEAP
jgi:serine/threonine protein phosphatase PrpC